MRLVTHSGTFHADDVMAYAVLSRLFPQASLVRTRDAAVLDALRRDDIAFDVGASYSHEARRYDHHMSDGPKREDGSPYSSVGLVWKHYGHAFLAAVLGGGDGLLAEGVWNAVDRSLVREIDLLDNGVGTMTGTDFPALVDDFNPAWDAAGAAPDAAFVDAARLAAGIMERRVAAAAAAERAFDIAMKAAREAEDPRIVVLPCSMPWERAIFRGGFAEALYVVYPRPDGASWFCSAVPPEPGSFAQRKPLPLEWAGLRDGDLEKATGTTGAIFCHPARFVCGASTFEGITDMARAAADWPSPGFRNQAPLP